MSMNTREYGQLMEEKAIPILKNNGFSDIQHSASNSPYDFTAKRNNKTCFIEVRSRNPDATTNFFTFSKSKIHNLIQLNEDNNVYLLFIRGKISVLCKLKEAINKQIPNIAFYDSLRNSNQKAYPYKRLVLVESVKCPRCEYIWNYKGKMFYATCPRCRKLIDIRKQAKEA